ncbi:MAG: response regulator, partial [Proteobacteria bacterium]|nr:response regulator [Pseudomonadota bacterium]
MYRQALQPEAAGKPLSSGHILLVDDDARITRMIRRVAEQAGFSVTEVNDSLRFEEIYLSTQASLIILDLNMPGKDGIELLDFLVEQNCKSRVMFISGVDKRVLGTTEQLAISRGLDVAGLLQKPIEVKQLRQVLDDHAKIHGVPSIEDLDLALSSGQILVAYQPKIDLGTGRVTGAEALALVARRSAAARGRRAAGATRRRCPSRACPAVPKIPAPSRRSGAAWRRRARSSRHT